MNDGKVDGARFALMGVGMRRLVSAAETGGTFSLFENSSEGPTRTPVHVHRDDDETLYVLEGEMQAVVAGETRTVRAGEAVFLPRGVPHQLLNETGQQARYLLLCTPSVFEAFLQDAGQRLGAGESPPPPTADDVQRLKAVAPMHGITLLPGW